ncbi:MAG: 4Fe-4S binding protein [Sulfuritalea sp.]|nr:4Fe-4S binding protein [Sulfuritalea sp.]MDP1985027.1 4Fe-4S binding protein [Sulfuritalea sp.]
MLQAKGIAALLLGCLLCLGATAGELSRADIERRFQRPLHVGEKLREIAAWPLTNELTPDAGPVGYVFESIDLAPIPGFEGTPMNLLVAIDSAGKFIDVEVLRQHEPVFLGGLGPMPLNEFVKQYQGKTLKQEITIASAYGNTRSARDEGGGNRVVLDGVTKATASVRIVNQSVLAAALAVARVRLGFADPGSGAPAAVVKALPFERMDLAALIRRGYVQRIAPSNAEIEKLFADSEGAGADELASSKPDEAYVEIHVAYLNAPIIGRNLLGDAAWEKFRAYLPDDRPAFWIATRGRYALVDDAFVPGTSPPYLALMQGELPIELRDANRDYAQLPVFGELSSALILTAPAHAGLDPGRPLEFRFTVSRARGMILPVVTRKQIRLHYAPPTELFDFPPKPPPEWLQAWQGRLPDLIVIGMALLLLSGVLLRPRAVSVRPRGLFLFRMGFLAFTLLFIGWYAQGQLSIVQITGAIKSLVAGAGLKSFLYDPVSLLLIAFTLLSLVVWGRGSFCGWLCPFGALQEFVALLARHLRVPQWRMPARLARFLARSRYALLALLVGSAAFAPAAAENLVEMEPFKTAITLAFQRELPFLLWAVGLLLAGAFVYKFFCRFVCPLGAALTIGGRLRRWTWLPRIEVCGQPCQRCRIACRYDAIEPAGAIDYDECHQCLDCVGIFHDTARCGPKLLKTAKGKTIRIRPARVRH